MDRDDTLRRAEKLLRQGRLDAAIAEYAKLVEDQPKDWATVNLLGDLYVRAGQVEQAAVQYTRIAEHLARVPEHWRALLQAACVEGEEYTAGVVAEAIG
jgi:Flp pilus assembly protein TadD